MGGAFDCLRQEIFESDLADLGVPVPEKLDELGPTMVRIWISCCADTDLAKLGVHEIYYCT